MRIFNRSLDFLYLAPALLCSVAFLAGIVPCVWCLDGQLFAYISLAIFIVSIFVHIYILFRWKRYKHSSPLAYAITQPSAHFIVMAFALCVGATNLCMPIDRDDVILKDNDLFQYNIEMSDVISKD